MRGGLGRRICRLVLGLGIVCREGIWLWSRTRKRNENKKERKREREKEKRRGIGTKNDEAINASVFTVLSKS